MNKAHSYLMQNPDEKTRSFQGPRPDALASPQGVRHVKSTPKQLREYAARIAREASSIDAEIAYWTLRMQPGRRTDQYLMGEQSLCVQTFIHFVCINDIDVICYHVWWC